MLRNLNNKRQGGFTLVEIMIVVAIIALLAAIAVPNFLRARLRTQATQTLEDIRQIDSAKDQFAIEGNLSTGAAVTWADIQKYLKTGTRLYTSNAKDITGADYNFGTTVGADVKVDGATITYFSSVVPNETQFWGSYKP